MKKQKLMIFIDETADPVTVVASGFTGYAGRTCGEEMDFLVDAIGERVPQPVQFGDQQPPEKGEA